MMFRYFLKESNINEEDITINTSVDFASLSSAFISKTAAYVNLFEDNASIITFHFYIQ